LKRVAALGTALAFMMSVIGLSLPEMIILKKVLKFGHTDIRRHNAVEYVIGFLLIHNVMIPKTF